MKKLLILASVLLSTASFSASANDKVGFVDLQRVVTNSAYSERLRKEMKKDLQPLANQMNTMTKAVNKMRQKLTKDGKTMSLAQRSKLQKEMRTKIYEAKIREASYKEEAQYREKEALDKVAKRAMQELEKIAKAGGYTLVVHKEAVMYATDAADLTNELTQALK